MQLIPSLRGCWDHVRRTLVSVLFDRVFREDRCERSRFAEANSALLVLVRLACGVGDVGDIGGGVGQAANLAIRYLKVQLSSRHRRICYS
jgi:hypothetical protein